MSRVIGQHLTKHRTSMWLYAYWNDLRKGRKAPERFEIQPAEIASLLPETFIVEVNAADNDSATSYDFRLVGTRICEQFGRELRGANLLDLWNEDNSEALETLLQSSVEDGSVSFLEFDAFAEDGRQVRFELLILPLVHASDNVNRLLGCLSAVDTPYWVGSQPLDRLDIVDAKIIWPDHQPHFLRADQIEDVPVPGEDNRIVTEDGRTFRVYEGGRD